MKVCSPVENDLDIFQILSSINVCGTYYLLLDWLGVLYMICGSKCVANLIHLNFGTHSSLVG